MNFEEFHKEHMFAFSKMLCEIEAKKLREKIVAKDRSTPEKDIKKEIKSKVWRHQFKGRKPKRDENKPKKPKNAYHLFCESERPKIEERMPNIKLPEMSALLGSRWKKVSDADKLAWKEKTIKPNTEYKANMQLYKEGKFVKEEEKEKEEVSSVEYDADDEGSEEEEEVSSVE